MAYLGSASRAYRGDPGFFSTLGSIGKAVVGGVSGFLTGGPAGAISGAIGAVRTPTRQQVMQAAGQAGPGTIFAPPRGAGTSIIPTPGFIGSVQRTLPGGSTGFLQAGVPRGYHLAKDGSGRVVRNRRTNFANPRALNRAIRRVEGFGRLVNRSKKSVRKAARSMGV